MKTYQFNVEYRLHGEFRQLAERNGCVVKNVIEIICCKLIAYILEYPEDKDELISEMAFMTFVRNPVFQKYYNGADEYEKIKSEYIQDQLKKHYE